MKKQLLKGLTIFGVFLTLIVGSVQAQTGYKIVVNVPFDFTAGETSLRAGVYSVELTSNDILCVRSIDGKKGVMLQARQAEPVGTQEPARIIFNRYGDRYFLSQAFLSVAEVGRQVNPSRAELHLAREYGFAKRDAKSQKVQVALRLNLK